MERTAFELRCPTCHQVVNSMKLEKHLPFCSHRCQLIDLGRWLSEENTIAVDKTGDEDVGAVESSGASKIRLPPGWHDA